MPDTKSNQSNIDSTKQRDVPQGDKAEQQQADAEDRTSQREQVSDDERASKIKNDLPDVEKRAKGQKTEAINDDDAIVREKVTAAEDAERDSPSK